MYSPPLQHTYAAGRAMPEVTTAQSLSVKTRRATTTRAESTAAHGAVRGRVLVPARSPCPEILSHSKACVCTVFLPLRLPERAPQ